MNPHDELQAKYGDRLEEMFPLSINPDALRTLIGEENWQSIVATAHQHLPASIIATLTDEDLRTMLVYTIRGTLSAYLFARYGLQPFLDE